MPATKRLRNPLTLAVPGLALALILTTHSAALPPPSPATALPAAPDFEIYDPHPEAIDEGSPDVAYNPHKDEYLVVFEHGSGPDHDVRGIIVSGTGVPAHASLPIAVDTNFDDVNPAVAYNPDDRSYLVVWQRSHQAESYRAIAGCVVSETVSAPFAVHWTLHGDQRHPDLAYASGPQRFLVVWESHEPFERPPDIVGTTVDSAGVDIPPRIRISLEGPTPGEQSTPAVAASGTTGRWLVTWRDTRTAPTTGLDIYGQQVQYTGSALSLWGDLVPVATVIGEAAAPAVAWGPAGGDGEFLVVWTENCLGDTTYAQRLRADNSPLGDLIAVSDSNAAKSNPVVTYAPLSSDWWVAWDSG